MSVPCPDSDGVDGWANQSSEIRLPDLITPRMLRRHSMSCSGSQATAMMSAALPGAIDPISLSWPS
jgi:hypothetical protein